MDVVNYKEKIKKSMVLPVVMRVAASRYIYLSYEEACFLIEVPQI